MLQEELSTALSSDPTFLRVDSPVLSSAPEKPLPYYVNPITLIFRLTPETYTRNRSRTGASCILAEDPGSGKTIMVLSLILLTKDELPNPVSGSTYHEPTVLTPALETYLTRSDSASSRIPPLRDIALHVAATSGVPSAVWNSSSDPSADAETDGSEVALPPHLAELVEKNVPYFMDFYPAPGDFNTEAMFLEHNVRVSKSAPHPPERVVLSSATLVVVPMMLRVQWDNEIRKHVHDGMLRVLVVKEKSDIESTSVESLARNYDVGFVLALSLFQADSICLRFYLR